MTIPADGGGTAPRESAAPVQAGCETPAGPAGDSVAVSEHAPPAPADSPVVTGSPEVISGTGTAGGSAAAMTDGTAAYGFRESLAVVAEQTTQIGQLTEAITELAALKSRDADLITRLHSEVTRLRAGEISTALNPIQTGMLKLHDQMVRLGALGDPESPVGMLHTQLLQTLELTCAVKPFSPAPGERFDAARHIGTRRVMTTDPAADGTIAVTMKVGFVRDDGSVVRVAEVEVHRLPDDAGSRAS